MFNSGIRSVLVFLVFACFACRQVYIPPNIGAAGNLLAVDGFINATPGDTTTFVLSYTRALNDTSIALPANSSQVLIEGKKGTSFQLTEKPAGIYRLAGVTFDPNDQYRLLITTREGRRYQSDFVPVKLTPLIDSLSWKQPDDLTIYVNTHDPLNQTRYYRWDYQDTWEYHAPLETILTLKNGLIYYTDSTDQIFKCWHSMPSTDIWLGNSLKLSDDVIQSAPVAVIPQNSQKGGIRYSIRVNQYALTEDAYHYWDVLKKNNQALGSLFGGQPGQLKGNIHSLTQPAEPVIGFISASTVTSARIFVDHSQLSNWDYNPLSMGVTCDTYTIPQDPSNWQIYNYADPAYEPYYFTSGGGIVLTRRTCVDCRLMGGTNIRPSFW